MCTTNAGRSRRTVFAAAVLVLALPGCGGVTGDKAGGARQARPTVLTLANSNGDTWELEPFAAAAARLSQGTLRIEFKNDWRLGKSEYEAGLIHDVKVGTVDLGWAGSRAFDS